MLHAIILYSMGSPQELNKIAVKHYLSNFLSDKLVVKMPRFLWHPILHSIILRTRPERLLKRYQQILIDGKNPYYVALDNLAANLTHSLNQNIDTPYAKLIGHENELPEPSLQNSKEYPLPEYIVVNACAYASLRLDNAIEQCIKDGANKITVIPLFPLYTHSTTKRPQIILNKAQEQYPHIEFNFINSYKDEELYIDVLIKSIFDGLKENNIDCKLEDFNQYLTQSNSHILFTYHGLPQSYIKLGDPYLKEVQANTKALVNTLKLEQKNYSIAFQSRFGPVPWLKPYLEEEIEKILKRNISRLIVLAPNFTIDCLENCFDLNIQLRNYFLSHGGDEFILAKALNDKQEHVKLIMHLIAQAKPIK